MKEKFILVHDGTDPKPEIIELDTPHLLAGMYQATPLVQERPLSGICNAGRLHRCCQMDEHLLPGFPGLENARRGL